MANSTYAYGTMKITSGAENGCKRTAKSIIEATAKFDHFPTFFSSKNAVSIDEISVVEKYIFDLEQMRKYIQRLTEEKQKLEEQEGKV